MTTDAFGPASPDALDSLRRMAAHLAGGDPDDLVQDSFLNVLRKRDPGLFTPRYLATVARNRARELWRQDERRRAREVAVSRAEDSVPSAAELAERNELLARLASELERLPEDLRVPLVLRYSEGLGSEAIAKRIGTNANTVRWRLSKARERLRARLDRAYGGDRESWCAIALPGLGAGLGARVAGGSVLAALLGKAAPIAIVAAAAALLVWFVARSPGSPAPASPGASIAELALEVDERPRVEPGLSTARTDEDRSSLEAAPAAPARSSKARPDSVVARADTGPAALRMRFVDEAGQPVADVRLDARTDADRTAVLSDGSGRARVESITADVTGSVRLEALDPRGSFWNETVNLAPGDDLDLGDVRLAPGVVLRGRVVAPDGTPIPGARVATRGAGTTTDERGAFELTGVLPGRFEPVASARGYARTVGEPLELAAGEVRDDLELVLEPRALHRLRVDLVDSDGRPAELGRFQYAFLNSSGSETRNSNTYLEQTFEYPEQLVRFRSLRADLGLGVTWQGAHDTNAGDLTLRLEPLARVALEFEAPRGRPVTATFRTADDPGFVQAEVVSSDAGEVQLLREAFVVELAGEGIADDVLGPFDPDRFANGSPLVLVARTAPCVLGTLVDATGPVAGAEVRLHPPTGSRHLTRHGFPIVLEGAVASARTDERGRFELDLRSLERFRVSADLEGRERFVSELLHPSDGDTDLGTLVWEAPARLHGTVRLADGASPAGKIVCATRGLGDPQTVRCDSRGRYAFERLAPGAWYVFLTDREVDAGSSGMQGERPANWEHPTNVTLRPGEDRRFDLVESPRARRTLELRAGRPGNPLVGVDLDLWEDGERLWFRSGVSRTLRTDEEGRASVAVPVDAELGFELRLSDRTDLVVHGRIEAGFEDVQLDLAVGLLDLELSNTAQGSRTVRLEWLDLDGLTGTLHRRLEPGGTLLLSDVPSGNLRISERLDGEYVVRLDAELQPGGLRTVSL